MLVNVLEFKSGLHNSCRRGEGSLNNKWPYWWEPQTLIALLLYCAYNTWPPLFSHACRVNFNQRFFWPCVLRLSNRGSVRAVAKSIVVGIGLNVCVIGASHAQVATNERKRERERDHNLLPTSSFEHFIRASYLGGWILVIATPAPEPASNRAQLSSSF